MPRFGRATSDPCRHALPNPDQTCPRLLAATSAGACCGRTGRQDKVSPRTCCCSAPPLSLTPSCSAQDVPPSVLHTVVASLDEAFVAVLFRHFGRPIRPCRILSSPTPLFRWPLTLSHIRSAANSVLQRPFLPLHLLLSRFSLFHAASAARPHLIITLE